jgi:DNA-directed RNA polymerase specialized sigma24 family protein
MPPEVPESPGAPRALPNSALTAFLHGIEARAWVFALCQGGDAARADQTLAAAELQFIAQAPSLPLAQWPLQFWTVLLRQPGLLAALHPELDLSRLDPGPRAALLLRLLANLDVPHAAEALGVSVRAYEAALGQAMAAPDHPEGWLPALREQLHALVSSLPESTRAHLDEIRREALERAAAPVPGFLAEAEAAADAEAASDASATPVEVPPPRWPWFGLGLLLLALLATLVFPLPGGLRPGQSEKLPQEVVPPPPQLSDTVIVTHPDYAQIAEPQDEVFARDLAFLSWLAGAFPATTPEPAATTLPPPEDFNALQGHARNMLKSAAPLWSTLAPAERAALLDNAQDWDQRNQQQRAAMRARLLAWDAQAPAERARRRTPFVAWVELPRSERTRVSAAHARWLALPETERASLRKQFAALDADTQRVWWLGPAMGQQLAPIAVFFAFLPEADRPALLDALRALDPVARAELSLLAPRLDEAGRQSLRRELLRLPPEQRAAFIHAKLGGAKPAQ